MPHRGNAASLWQRRGCSASGFARATPGQDAPQRTAPSWQLQSLCTLCITNPQHRRFSDDLLRRPAGAWFKHSPGSGGFVPARRDSTPGHPSAALRATGIDNRSAICNWVAGEARAVSRRAGMSHHPTHSFDLDVLLGLVLFHSAVQYPFGLADEAFQRLRLHEADLRTNAGD